MRDFTLKNVKCFIKPEKWHGQNRTRQIHKWNVLSQSHVFIEMKKTLIYMCIKYILKGEFGEKTDCLINDLKKTALV